MQLKTPELNEDLFHELMNILYFIHTPKRPTSRLLNDAAVARCLGISKHRLLNMREKAPKEWWWNTVLREAIARETQQLPAKRQRKVWKRLHRYNADPSYVGAAAGYTDKQMKARKLLLRVLREGPTLYDTIRQEANGAGVKENMIHTISDQLGIVKQRVGKGKEHRSLWMLPEDHSDYNDE